MMIFQEANHSHIHHSESSARRRTAVLMRSKDNRRGYNVLRDVTDGDDEENGTDRSQVYLKNKMTSANESQ